MTEMPASVDADLLFSARCVARREGDTLGDVLREGVDTSDRAKRLCLVAGVPRIYFRVYATASGRELTALAPEPV